REKTTVIPAPEPAPTPVADARPVPVLSSSATPQALEHLDALLARASAAREEDQALILEQLYVLGDLGAVALAERLPSVPPKLLSAAGSYLARIQSSAALPALRHHVAGGPTAVRREAALALAETAREEAVADLVPLLRDRDAGVRVAGIEALVRTGSPKALEDVAALGADADGRVRAKAYAAAFGWAEAHGLRDRLHEALARAFEGSTGRARGELVRALSAASPERGLDLVTKALWDPEKEARSAAAVALAQAPADRAAAAVIQRLGDETDKDVRLRLAATAEQLKLDGAVEPLLGWLTDEDEQVQRAAASILQTLTRRNFGLDVEAWKAWWRNRAESR
ncbi:MAG TPA: HEAT repeat domain-containing protein, partial [Planctomycetota bacterium]|nr:HEAT repeat domain-containing protein [Planctomycetota bacterium]